jgi:hypothetical protein
MLRRVCAVALVIIAGRCVELSYQTGFVGELAALTILREEHPEARTDAEAVLAAGHDIPGRVDLSDVPSPLESSDAR